MTQMKNDDDLKIKNSFLINLNSRSEEKKTKFTRWINAQSNAQSSILSVIEHMIDRFGYEDVMDHEVARKLYMEQLHFSNPENTNGNGLETASQQAFEAPKEKGSNKAEPAKKEPAAKPITEMPIDGNAF